MNNNPTGKNQYTARGAARAMRASISKEEQKRPSSRKSAADGLRVVRKGGLAFQAGKVWGAGNVGRRVTQSLNPGYGTYRRGLS